MRARERAHRLAALALWLAVALGQAGAAAAGPWPRAAGSGFVAGSLRWERGRATAHETYAEFGLRPRLTLVLALRHSGPRIEADMLARWHPPDPGGGWVWAVGTGVQVARGRDTRLILDAEVGRGLQTALGGGWAQTGVRLIAGRGGGAQTEWRIQAGLRHGRWVGMAGATRLTAPGYAEIRLRAGVGYALTDRLTLVAEAAPGRAGGRRSTLWQVGMWSTVPAAR